MTFGKGIKHSARTPIVAYIAADPSRTLTAKEASERFGISLKTTAYDAFAALVRDGWLEESKQGWPKRWSAGPRLTNLIQTGED